MRWVALALLAGCSLNRSAEREDSFAQQGESRREEGPWTRETWEWASPPGGSGAKEGASTHRTDGLATVSSDPKAFSVQGKPSLPAASILRHTVETHAPITTTSTTTVEASGEAKEARSARFGFSPWQWAIGGLALLAGLYGLWRVKQKLAI